MQVTAKNNSSKYVEKMSPAEKITAWISRVVIWIVMLIVLFPIMAIIFASLSGGTSFSSGSLLPTTWADPWYSNYTKLLSETDFVSVWLRNSLIISISVGVIQLLLTVPAAFAFSKLRFKFRNQGLMGLLILQMFPTTMALPAIITICLNCHMDNNLLTVVLLQAGGSAYNIWLMKGYMDGIPDDLVEAAYVDGATTMQVFLKIILPLMRNMLLVIFLFAFIGAYSEFIYSKSLLKNPEVQTLATGLQGFIKDSFNSNWTQYSAAAILSSVPVVALFMALQKYVASGLTAGSVKG